MPRRIHANSRIFDSVVGDVLKVWVALWVAFALLPSDAAAQARSCGTLAQVSHVRDLMSDMYLWYRDIPALNALRFESPEDYLEAARYRPLDSSFSYITSREANDAFYSDSEYIGFGFSNRVEGDALVVTQVFPSSPASDAGLRRGDRIVSIDGQRVAMLLENGGLDAALGPAEEGVSRELSVERGDGPSPFRMTKRVVTIPTVMMTRVFEVRGRKVGYVFFRNFVRPSTAALDAAFAELRQAGVTELVLDLRYNGGGLVTVAQHLADLIGGSLTNGQVFAVYAHNDRNPQLNETLRFGSAEQALDLSRVVMITTRASASASELVANALRPYMPVVLVGDRTFGKPVGQYGFEFCTKVLALVSFSLKNADGQADYFNGLAPTCQAADDVTHEIGDLEEASLREALQFIDSDRCSDARVSEPGPAPLALPRQRAPNPTNGWQQLIGAN